MSDSPGAPQRIAILGAGPTGLEAALAAAERGWTFDLYERAPTVAGNVRDWEHVRVFTPWSMNASPRARGRLGDRVPSDETCPTGAELSEHLFEPLAALADIQPGLRLGTQVVAVGRQGLLKHEEISSTERARRPFRLLVRDDDGERVEHADLVIDCSGSYSLPNRLGDGGIPAPGEEAASHRIDYRIPDLEKEAGEWAGKTILLVGAGHSAQTAASQLAQLAESQPGTRVIWAVRNPRPTWGATEDDPLAERAALAERSRRLAAGEVAGVEVMPGVVVERLEENEEALGVVLRDDEGKERREEVDRVLALTGAVGDHQLYRQLQIHECYASSGPMKLAAALLGAAGGDCLAQSSHGADTLMNPEPGFFILGAKSYGRNNTFLMRVGWEQVDDLFAHLDGLSTAVA